MKQHIKTSCGIEKYKELSSRQGLFNRFVSIGFCFFAVIRDLLEIEPKPNSLQEMHNTQVINICHSITRLNLKIKKL